MEMTQTDDDPDHPDQIIWMAILIFPLGWYFNSQYHKSVKMEDKKTYSLNNNFIFVNNSFEIFFGRWTFSRFQELRYLIV